MAKVKSAYGRIELPKLSYMTYGQRLTGMTIMARIFATISLALPLMVVPMVSYRFNNCWLLFGAIFSVFGSVIYVTKKGNGIVTACTLVCIGFWMKEGFNIHQYVTFFYFCLLAGFMSYGIMKEYIKRKSEIYHEFQNELFHEMTDGETRKTIEEEIAKLREQQWKIPD